MTTPDGEGRDRVETHPLWIEVDLGCIRRNVSRMKALLAPGTMLLAVVKANAYGHGDVPCARAAIDGGADLLAVARVGEVAALRAGGIEVPSSSWQSRLRRMPPGRSRSDWFPRCTRHRALPRSPLRPRTLGGKRSCT